MTFEQMIVLVDEQMDDILYLLDKEDIDYGASRLTANKTAFNDGYHRWDITRMLYFPWCEGKLIVGTLRDEDNRFMKINISEYKGERLTIMFIKHSSDGGGKTIYNTPEEFVEKLKAYYKEVMGK